MSKAGIRTPRHKGRRRSVLLRLLRHRSGGIGLLLSVLFVLMAIVGPYVAPIDPAFQDYLAISQGPGKGHLLGTDNLGRDLFSRILAGARYSIGIGVSATLLGALVGGLWGLWAGYSGGWIDNLSMRLVDILLAFPGILLAIALITITGPGVFPLTLAAAVFGVPIFARLVRGSVLAFKEQTHIEAARGLGAAGGRIMFRHLLPAVVAPVLVYISLRIGVTLLVASGLSFLGLGVQPPAPEWGAMLSDAQLYLSLHPIMAFAPGVTITLAVLGFNLLGDGLRDVLDPRLGRDQ